ncbi:MAG: ABC transporter permease [Ruminococcus sp.]|nr:ABC transporter permease [Ruminococcus sp.]
MKKRIWKRIKKRYIAAAVINAAAIAAMAVLTAAGGSLAKSQSWNMAAHRWGCDSSDKFIQMSCFFSENADFSKNDAKGLYSKLMSKLKDSSIVSEDGKKLVPQAYSAPLGKYSVKCDRVGRSDAELIAAGGDFFLFHDFRLISGAYFSDDDLMQDGAVIDKELAWALYGSSDIAGKNIYINNIKLYIAGVIEQPSSSAEKKCIGKLPMAYVSYETAGKLSGGTSFADAGMMAGVYNDGSGTDMLSDPQTENKFSKITCYECIVPEPVENFAENTISDYFKGRYTNEMEVVNNTERFDPKKRAKQFGKLYRSVIKDDEISYPFWENSSRIVEYRLSCYYGMRRIISIIPILTGLWLIAKLFIFARRRKGMLRKKLSDLWLKIRKTIKKDKKPDIPDISA